MIRRRLQSLRRPTVGYAGHALRMSATLLRSKGRSLSRAPVSTSTPRKRGWLLTSRSLYGSVCRSSSASRNGLLDDRRRDKTPAPLPHREPGRCCRACRPWTHRSSQEIVGAGAIVCRDEGLLQAAAVAHVQHLDHEQITVRGFQRVHDAWRLYPCSWTQRSPAADITWRIAAALACSVTRTGCNRVAAAARARAVSPPAVSSAWPPGMPCHRPTRSTPTPASRSMSPGPGRPADLHPGWGRRGPGCHDSAPAVTASVTSDPSTMWSVSRKMRMRSSQTVHDKVIGQVGEFTVGAQELHASAAFEIERVVQAVGDPVKLQRRDSVESAQYFGEHRCRLDPAAVQVDRREAVIVEDVASHQCPEAFPMPSDCARR